MTTYAEKYITPDHEYELKIQDLGWLTIKQSAQSHDPYGSDYVDS